MKGTERIRKEEIKKYIDRQREQLHIHFSKEYLDIMLLNKTT